MTLLLVLVAVLGACFLAALYSGYTWTGDEEDVAELERQLVDGRFKR